MFLVAFQLVNLVQYFHALYYVTKHNVFAIQVGQWLQREEELASVSIGSIVGHAQQSFFGVNKKRRLILELPPHITVLAVGWIDAFPSSAVPFGKVTSLDTHSRYQTMDFAGAITQVFGGGTLALFSRTKAAKIFGGKGGLVGKELDDDSPYGLTVHRKIHKTLRPGPRGWKHPILAGNIFLFQFAKERLFFSSIIRQCRIDRV